MGGNGGREAGGKENTKKPKKTCKETQLKMGRETQINTKAQEIDKFCVLGVQVEQKKSKTLFAFLGLGAC